MRELFATNKLGSKNLADLLINYGNKADSICVVSAFFSDTNFISDWSEKGKKVELLISLRPPTNYYSLRKIYPKSDIRIHFLDERLHSKFFIFYNKNKAFACIIGSSNFTQGGLRNNFETNVILKEKDYLKEIENHFSLLWNESQLLHPNDLEDFKVVFDNFQKRETQNETEQREMLERIGPNRARTKNKSKIAPEAKQYFSFLKATNEVKSIVKEISEEYFPNIPVFQSLDHFWYWIKEKTDLPSITEANQKSVILDLFREYCQWDIRSHNITIERNIRSKTFFSKLLADDKIENLEKENAREIYRNLHSGHSRSVRFNADKKFVEENDIKKIRSSLKYLLHSDEDLELRIHDLLKNPEYQLKELGSSGVQELLGWVDPKNYPKRNDPANKALELLGYTIK